MKHAGGGIEFETLPPMTEPADARHRRRRGRRHLAHINSAAVFARQNSAFHQATQ